MSDAVRVCLLGVALIAAFPAAAQAPNDRGPLTSVQVWLGAQNPDDDSWEVIDPGNGQTAAGEIGTLPFGGGAGQLLWGDGVWRYGYEGGALASWKSETTSFRGTNNSAEVTIDGEYFSFGVFMGGVLSANLSRSARVYVAAGPTATWAWLDDSGDEPIPAPTGVIVLGDSEDDVSFTAYGRAGVEVILENGFAFGASVRYAKDEFDFGAGGKLEFEDPLWLLTLGAHL